MGKRKAQKDVNTSSQSRNASEVKSENKRVHNAHCSAISQMQSLNRKKKIRDALYDLDKTLWISDASQTRIWAFGS